MTEPHGLPTLVHQSAVNMRTLDSIFPLPTPLMNSFKLLSRAMLAISASTAFAVAPCAIAQNCGNGTDSCLTAHTLPGCSDSDCCNTVCAISPECCIVTWDASCAATADSNCIGLCGATASGTCTTPHNNGACSDGTCCNAVCTADPFCCSSMWDSTCVFMADFYCVTAPPVECGLPGQGDCTAVHSTPGCSDSTCCNVVCGIDPSCCTGAWDQFCVQFAVQYCSGCTVSCPAGATTEPEGCGTRNNDPCESAGQTATPMSLTNGACGELNGFLVKGVWSGDRDIYSVTIPDTDGDGTARAILHLASTVPAFAVLVPALCPVNIPGAVISVNAPNCVDATTAACVAPGDYWVLVAPGTFPTVGASAEILCDQLPRYTVRVEVSQLGCSPVCSSNAGPCFEVHANPGCEDATCCEATCAIDPFCCNSGWDYDCARQAAVTCGAPIPVNDTCAGALPLSIGQTIEFTTMRAVSEGPNVPATCEVGTGVVMGPDLWYSYNGERSGNVVVSTCGSATDLRIVVYGGTCAAPTVAGCGSSSVICSPSTGARVQFAAVCGNTYLIRVGGESSQIAGPGRITLTAPGPVCPAFCPPDLNRDHVVDGADIGLLLGNWGFYGIGDLNIDGQINGADLGILLGAWGACP